MIERNPLAASKRKKSPQLSQRTQEDPQDYFSRSKELLVTSSRSFLSPQLARLRAETPTSELPSTLKSPTLFR